jgi:large subunit ribosomal protein L23
MALFGSKKKTEVKKTEKAVAVKDSAGMNATGAGLQDVILRPRITEKSGLANESFNVYTFEIAQNASKGAVARAIKAKYKVTPAKVRTINLPAKQVFNRGRWGMKSPIKKAMVYLKKGDKIVIE